MSLMTDPGRDGPHPDVLAEMARHMNDEPLAQFREVTEVREDDIGILQQRTLYQLPWSNLWGRSWFFDEDEIEVDVSIGLGIHEPEGLRSQIVMYWANRLPDREWAITQSSLNWLDDPPWKSYPGFMCLNRGLGITCSALAIPPDLGKISFTFADGHGAESSVSNGNILLFVPFSSAERWSSTARLAIHDTQGNELMADSYDFQELYLQSVRS